MPLVHPPLNEGSSWPWVELDEQEGRGQRCDPVPVGSGYRRCLWWSSNGKERHPVDGGARRGKKRMRHGRSLTGKKRDATKRRA
jgi:hypothetical protein